MSPPNSAPHSSHDLNWYPDTGATNHVTSDLGNLNLQAEEYNGSDQLRVGNGQGLDIKHLGSSKLHYPHVSFTLQNLLHVPNIQKNLLSVSQFTRDNNVFFEFHPHFFCVKDPQTGTTLLRGQSKNGLYTLPSIPPLTRFALVGERASLDRWHCRLGHPSLRIVSQVVRTNALATLKNKASTVCHACRLGKSHELPFHLSSSISMHPLDLLFTDVWGPSPSPSINGKRYYVCFVDDFSKFTWLFPIAAKSEVTSIFLSFQSMWKNYLIVKSRLSNQIGVVNSTPLILFWPNKEFLTESPVLIPINNKAQLNENTDISLKPVCRYWLQPPCL
jgi:hypothetical protein